MKNIRIHSPGKFAALALSAVVLLMAPPIRAEGDPKDGRNEAAPESVGKRFPNSPRATLNVGGDYVRGRFGASLTGQYMSKRFSSAGNTDIANGVYGAYDPFFKTDLKLRYKLQGGITASFTINNLFDREYYNYYRTAGRWFVAEIAYSIFDRD